MIPKRLLIDTDTASDDAVALVMALRLPESRVELITTVAGNVNVARATRNALYTVELCGADVPVVEGFAKPLLHAHVDATEIHGADGMGNTNYPPPQRRPTPGRAPDALITAARAAPGELTLVTLGPLTNIAIALLREPRFATLLKETIVMGGAANTVGNQTPSAEYNMWCDPEAARVVFRSGMRLTMVPFEVCLGDALLSDAETDALAAIGTPYARFCTEINRFLVDATEAIIPVRGLNLPDPLALAAALDPAIITDKGDFFVDIETDSNLTRGETVVDRYGVLKKPANATVALAADGPRFKAMLRRAVSAEV